MRVALVHNLRTRGGAWRRIREQLRAAHLDVQEFTLEGAIPVTDDPIVIPLRLRADTSWPLARPGLRYLDLLRLERAYSGLEMRLRQADVNVIWCNPCSLLQTPPLTSAVGVPIVYYCDEPRRADYDPVARASMRVRTQVVYAPLRRAQRHLDRRGVANADVLVTNSRYSAQLIHKAYNRRAKVLPLGVGTHFKPGSKPLTHILSVGTLIPSKGHGTAIEAVASSGLGLPLVVVSPRPDETEEARLRAIAKSLGVSLVVKVLVSDEYLVSLYQGALATLYLAQDEPLGLASLESQACGTPVIVSSEGGLPETIVEGGTGWAVPRVGPVAGQSLCRLADPLTRAQMSGAAASHGQTFLWADSGGLIRQELQNAIA